MAVPGPGVLTAFGPALREPVVLYDDANVPLFHSVAEDYVVEADGPNRCTFTWTVALAPTALGRPGGAVYGFLFNRFFKDTTRHFAAW